MIPFPAEGSAAELNEILCCLGSILTLLLYFDYCHLLLMLLENLSFIILMLSLVSLLSSLLLLLLLSAFESAELYLLLSWQSVVLDIVIINFGPLILTALTCVWAMRLQHQVASRCSYVCSTFSVFGLLGLFRYNLMFYSCLH